MKKIYADMDPVEEIRSIRADLMREFKSLDALCEYLGQEKTPPTKAKASQKVSGRRKADKHLAHA